MANPKTIEVSDDWHQDFIEPIGYAVLSFDHEARLFDGLSLRKAQAYADELNEWYEEHEGEGGYIRREVYPLFAAPPMAE